MKIHRKNSKKLKTIQMSKSRRIDTQFAAYPENGKNQ